MTELRIRLKARELEHLWRNRETFFAPADTYTSKLIRAKFLWALENLGLDEQPKRSHQRKTPPPPPGDPPVTEPDPYADEPEEDA